MVTRSVLKFGGSSVSDFTKIKRIAEMLKERVNQDEQLIVVVSAMGNTTDQLMTNVSTLTKTPRTGIIIDNRRATNCILFINGIK